MMESIIGLDIGTTGCKATLFDCDGAVRHRAYREYPVGAYTGSISADMIWEQVQQVICACTAQTPEIAAICATSFGEVVVPVDAAGHTLAEAMLYTNAAAQAQWKRLDEKLGGKRIHMITGHVSHSMYTISNLMRIRETEPEVYAYTQEPVIQPDFPFDAVGVPRDYRFARGRVEVPVWHYGTHVIWGITAKVLHRMLPLL